MARRLVKVFGSALFVFTVAVAVAPPASASHGNGLHWIRPTSNMLRNVAVVDKTGSPDWATKIRSAINSWNAGLNTVELVYSTGSTGGCSLNNGRIEICLGSSSSANWRYNTYSHLLGAIVTLNRNHFSAAEAMACHELGHTLGLRHRSERSSCLTSTVYASQTKPDAHDYRQVDLQHNH